MIEASPVFCERCGAQRTAGAPAGLCPRCLMENVLAPASGVASGAATGAPGRVLEALAATVGPMPSILLADLRDTDDAAPLDQPLSPELPPAEGRMGRLQFFGEIARGGMGAVLRGRDADLGREIAVKVLLERHCDDPELIRRFVEEAQIAGQLQHPGIVPVYELGTFANRRPFFTMKLVKGHTLAELLRDRSGSDHDLPRLLTIFLQVLHTVAYAHARGVIHRDLKPSNVMVGSFGEVQVMDWGLAKVLPRGGAVDDASAGRTAAHETVIATARSGGDDSDLSRAGSVLGTPAYMAPEQARGEVARLDARCDVFALGSILCEVLTGAPAFSGRSSGEIQRKAARGETADALARLASSGADPELLALACACLAAEGEDRPRDAGVVAARLSAHLAGVQERLRTAELAGAAAAARAEEAEGRARAERRARRLTAALAAAVIGLIALGSSSYTWSVRQHAARARQIAAAVDSALAESARLAGEARVAPEGAEAKWAEAIAQARRSEDLVKQGEADDTTRHLVAQAVAQVTRQRDEAEDRARRAEADQRLLERLTAIRGRDANVFGDPTVQNAQDNREYADAFRAAGLDPDARPAEAGAAIRARPPAVALAVAAALDDWALTRKEILKDTAGAVRLWAAARAADPDPWRCDLRAAYVLPDAAQRLTELRRLAGSARIDDLGPTSLDMLGCALRDAGDLPAAETTLRAAQRRHPGDFWLNVDLADVLQRRGRYEEAIRFYYAARAARPTDGYDLVSALERNNEVDEALAVLRELSRVRPERYLSQLGSTLKSQGRREEADAAFEGAVKHARALVRKQPDSVGTHLELAQTLYFWGKNDAAEAEFREAVRHGPSDSHAHGWLGQVLMRKNPAEAEILFRRAIELEPNFAGSRNGLGIALAGQGRHREAEAAYREAVRLAPEMGLMSGNLATNLRRQGRLAEAEAVYRDAIKLSDRSMQSGYNFILGELLMSQNRLDDAQAAFRQGAALAGSNTRFADTFTHALGEVERRIALYPRLPAILKGDDRPADPREGLDLAQLCLAGGRPAAAARLFADALAAEPALAEVRKTSHRAERHAREYAARAAALAGCGKGQDDPPPDDAARARLRRQALDWLRAELAAMTQNEDGGTGTNRNSNRATLAGWQVGLTDFDGVRSPEALTRLPAAEQADWRAFWAEVESAQQRFWTDSR